MLNFEELAAQLIRALRGRRSQVGFSRRLGFKANVVYTWEAGARFPSASTFLGAADRAGVDLRAGLARFYRIVPGWIDTTDLTSREAVAALLGDLRGSTPIVDVAKRVGCSRYALGRWLKGDAEPRLPDFLRAVDATSQRVLDFVAVFCDPAHIPAARRAWRRLEDARSLFVREPWSQAVLLTLELEAYRALPAHDDGWIAAVLDLDEETVTRCVRELHGSGQIRRAGAHYSFGQVQALDTRRHPHAGRFLKAWWARRALERLEADAEGLFSFNVFTVSEADHQRLRALHLEHYQAMRAIIARSEPGERLVLANLHLVPISGPAPP